MDKSLRSLHIKLDSAMQTLTQNAIAQLLVKLVYYYENPISESELLQSYKKIVKQSYNEITVKDVIANLITNNEIKYENNKYRLAGGKRKKIQKDILSSQERFDIVVKKYFPVFFSDNNTIADCLIDAIIHFFESYSNEWISDLNYREQYVINSKRSIVETIIKRIQNNKKLDKRDLDTFSDNFIEFITTQNDPDVDSLLWEYGTSAFAAKLIKISTSATPMTIDIFKGSTCILDTNILMNIGLEAGELYKNLQSVEKSFAELNISVGVLKITKEEYECTIKHIKDETIRLVSKGFAIDVLEESSDQYLKTAIARGCSDVDDFETFFDGLDKTPTVFDSYLPIEIVNHDDKLDEVISLVQSDEKQLEALNNLYYYYWSRYKNQHALKHDMGMLSGVEYLRTKGKFFILSQESSVNAYSKKRPLSSELPLSIKLETLINVLSITNTGIDTNASHMSLFASMIRTGLTPNRGTFKPEDLQYMVDRDEHISQLPPEETIEIAKHIYSLRVNGERESDISLELTRRITKAKFKLKDDLDKAKLDISNEKRDKERFQEELDKSNRALLDFITKESKKEYMSSVRKEWYRLLYSAVPLLACSYPLYLLLKTNLQSVNVFWNVVICLFVNIVTNLIWYSLGVLPKIKELRKERDNIISEKVSRKRRAMLVEE